MNILLKRLIWFAVLSLSGMSVTAKGFLFGPSEKTFKAPPVEKKTPLYSVKTLLGVPFADVFYVKCSDLPKAVYNPARLAPYQVKSFMILFGTAPSDAEAELVKYYGAKGSAYEKEVFSIPAVLTLKKALVLAKPASVSFVFQESTDSFVFEFKPKEGFGFEITIHGLSEKIPDHALGFIKAFIKDDYGWMSPGLKFAGVGFGVVGIAAALSRLFLSPKKPSLPVSNPLRHLPPVPPVPPAPPVVVKSFATRVFEAVRGQLRNLPTSPYYLSPASDCFVGDGWCSCFDKPCDHGFTSHIEFMFGESLDEKVAQISQKLNDSKCRLLFVSALRGDSKSKILEACCGEADDSRIQHRILLMSKTGIINNRMLFRENIEQLRKNRWLVLVMPSETECGEDWESQDIFPGLKPDSSVVDLHSSSDLPLAYIAPIYHERVDALCEPRAFLRTEVASSLFLNLPRAGACRYIYGDGDLNFLSGRGDWRSIDYVFKEKTVAVDQYFITLFAQCYKDVMLNGFWRKDSCIEDLLFADAKTLVKGVDLALADAFRAEVDPSKTAECIDSLRSLADYCESKDGARGFDDSKRKVRIFCASERNARIDRNDQIKAFAEELKSEQKILLKTALCRDLRLKFVVFVCASDLVREVSIKGREETFARYLSDLRGFSVYIVNDYNRPLAGAYCLHELRIQSEAAWGATVCREGTDFLPEAKMLKGLKPGYCGGCVEADLSSAQEILGRTDVMAQILFKQLKLDKQLSGSSRSWKVAADPARGAVAGGGAGSGEFFGPVSGGVTSRRAGTRVSELSAACPYFSLCESLRAEEYGYQKPGGHAMYISTESMDEFGVKIFIPKDKNTEKYTGQDVFDPFIRSHTGQKMLILTGISSFATPGEQTFSAQFATLRSWEENSFYINLKAYVEALGGSKALIKMGIKIAVLFDMQGLPNNFPEIASIKHALEDLFGVGNVFVEGTHIRDDVASRVDTEDTLARFVEWLDLKKQPSSR